MISIIKGTIQTVSKDAVVVMTASGLGYKVNCLIAELPNYRIADNVKFFTYLKVSDSALDLYGFETAEQKSFFELLLTVSGVGPKAAMRILSLGSIGEIQNAIARGDAKYLTAVQGMGKKTAERLCVELKNKVQCSVFSVQRDPNGAVLEEVIEALVSMGYSREDAKIVVHELEVAEKTTEQLLRLALRAMK
jgi:holliday junction DNA helicase RuvA